MQNTIDISLEGDEKFLAQLFSFTSEKSASGLTNLETFIGHFVNQTLQRDGLFGAWAKVWKIDTGYNLKISSPHHDLSRYSTAIPEFIAAGGLALEILQQNQEKLDEVIKSTGKPMQFILPWGLALGKVKSVQMLHFPPIEAFIYSDYIFSPTNRRWENLLGYNGLDPIDFPKFESIVDCVPIGAPGGDTQGITPFNQTFGPYIKKMLQARLTSNGFQTQPVIACGSPVHDLLQAMFPDQITCKPKTLDILKIKLYDDGTITPFLIANHPSQYLYFTDKPFSEEKKNVLMQDLIATGWQSRMSENFNGTSEEILEDLKTFWTNHPDFEKIMAQEDLAYNFKA
ncbi:hypothetical protein [Algoriphagus boritolerans]|uniref:Uncharacterized protein n=1 Tax=Algoriphagus boritolerans DSM 17298 = JCM 18970 TaxID=1120964 RepID=A0A1H6ADA7_9BACT|nr:hypothetical protein [Algoriphagus boritolerans]SEG45736.1 hypothetical protein SAMN03080598_04025 [Algoriphagus boritolerans DSM 17298 = JCM 18970]